MRGEGYARKSLLGIAEGILENFMAGKNVTVMDGMNAGRESACFYSLPRSMLGCREPSIRDIKRIMRFIVATEAKVNPKIYRE